MTRAMMTRGLMKRAAKNLRVACVLGILGVALGCGGEDSDAVSPNNAPGPMEESARDDIEWAVESELLYTTIGAAAADGTLYFGAWDGKLYAVAADGTQKWTVQTADKVNAAPAVAPDGSVVFGSWDKTVRAINADGSEKWRFEADALVDVSPSIDPEGRVLVASDNGTLYQLSADGDLLQSVSLEGAATTAVSIFDDGSARTYYIGGADNAVYCLTDAQLAAGEFTRSAPLKGHPVDDIALDAAGSAFFGTTGGHIVRVGRDCQVVFSESLSWAPVSAPAMDASGDLYVGMLSDQVARVGAQDGSRKWAKPTLRHAPLLAGPTYGSDGKFYAGANGLISFDSGGNVKLLSALDVLTSPLLLGGAAYVTTERGEFARLKLELAGVGESSWPIQHGNLRRTNYLKP